MRLPGGNGFAGKKFHGAGTNGFAPRYAVMSTEEPEVQEERAAGTQKMNEEKPFRPISAGQKPSRPESKAQESQAHKPHRPEATMHTDAPVRKAGGRLSREDQRRLGDILQRAYDDVVRQGVPDRFKDLLTELDDSREGAEAKAAAPGQSKLGQGEGGRSPEPDRLVEARGRDNPNKGSS
jgi:Anti-sigma factor NepR